MSSKLHIVPELFLEKNELKHLVRFISDDINNNFKDKSSSFGVIRNRITDQPFDNFKVEVGTNSGTIKLVPRSTAIDKDGLYIVQEPFDNVAIPNDGVTYHIVISHQYYTLEQGDVSISADGILTGVGTLFTDVLRGQPNFPTKVKLYNTSINTGEYQVVEVTSDGSAVLSGAFSAESGLRYSVIGTFSPTAVIPSIDREIYRYDSCLFRIIDDTTFLSMTLVSGKEFKIATAVNTSGTVSVSDSRNDIYTSLDKEFVDGDANLSPNPLIGVESIKWDNLYSTKDKNEVSIAWGFRSTNWTVAPSLRKITLSAGEGGVFKTSGDFTTGDFDGWRLYDVNGNYKIITTSTKSSTSIDLIVENLNPADYTVNDELFVCPDVEEVIISVADDGNSTSVPQVVNRYPFPVNTKVAKVYLLVPSLTPYLYNFSYIYKRFNRYSLPALFPDDSVGYYDESSYTGGVLNPNPIDRNRVTVSTPSPSTDGYILLTPDPSSYNTVINRIDIGDLLGVRNLALSPLLFAPTLDLYVSTDRQYQRFTGATFTMTGDSLIVLNKLKLNGDSLRNGNSFILHFDQFINDAAGVHKLKIVTDYVDSITFTLLYQLTDEDIDFINGIRGYNNGAIFMCTFYTDGVNPANDEWIIAQINETKSVTVAELTLFSSIINANLVVMQAQMDATDLALTTFQNEIEADWDEFLITLATQAAGGGFDPAPGSTLSSVNAVSCFRYKIIGKTLTFQLRYYFTTTGASATEFNIKLSSEFLSSSASLNIFAGVMSDMGGNGLLINAYIAPNSGVMRLRNNPTANLPIGTYDLAINGSINIQ